MKRIFATSRIGDPAENRLRERGYELEVFQGPEAPPKTLIIEKVKSGIDALITTLRDRIDAEVFEAGKGSLKVVAQIAVGFRFVVAIGLDRIGPVPAIAQLFACVQCTHAGFTSSARCAVWLV